MFFRNLELKNFRNFSSIDLKFEPGVSVFLGKNAQGKTNLLEALYFLTKGQSFRPGKNDIFINDKVKMKANIFSTFIKGDMVKSSLDYLVRLELLESRKNIAVNNKKVSSSYLTKSFPVILFSPESLTSIKSGPEARRSLIDDFLQLHKPENIKVINDYKKVLRNKNRLLKDLKAGFMDRREGLAVLQSLNEAFLACATLLTWARLKALEDIRVDLKEVASSILKKKNVDISVDYLISSQSILGWDKSQIFNALQKRINELVTPELDSGSSLVGPHKHDIQFLMDGRDSRFFCSQGQQRALILSFKMAQIVYHYRINQEYPLLMLDDVLSELDSEKQANLLDFLTDIKSQIFMTTTEFSKTTNFGRTDLSTFIIDKGVVFRDS